uniref:Uncharacterized protein n=1 Tax=Rhizophora mucronata TaxID=61149 RepID=A0A2P2JB07_RHIMU
MARKPQHLDYVTSLAERSGRYSLALPGREVRCGPNSSASLAAIL